MTDLLSAALEWAELGIPVFPVDQHKRPLTKNGHKDASTDPDTVRALFSRPSYGIGGAMGKAAGAFVIDADTYKDGSAGDSAKGFIAELERSGLLPPTRVHTTARGGTHYLYLSDTAWPNCKPCPGVEVKGEGGYVVLPPTPGYSVATTGATEAPPSLLKRLVEAKRASSNMTIDALKQRILSGEDFHDSITQLSARLAALGHDQESVQADILGVLDASVAAHPEHQRHDRWRSIRLGAHGELSRMVRSGQDKFNSSKSATILREAAARTGAIRPDRIATPKETGVGAKVDPSVYQGEWPFEGGYFGNETLPIQDQRFVVHPILSENEVTIISAAPKAGKTLIAQTVAMHLAFGSDCGDLRVYEKRPVLYFALESQTAIRRRTMAWKHAYNLDPKDAKDFPFYVYERPLNLLKEEEREELAAKIAAADIVMQRELGCSTGCIVFDTMTKAMPGGDQNSVQDTSAVFDVIQRIRSKGVVASIVFIHHDSKNGTTRGSSNIEAEPDTLLTVKVDSEGYYELSVRMARSIDDDASFKFKVGGVDLGKTVQGYDLKAPVALPADRASIAADHASSRLAKARQEIKILDEVALMGLGAHQFPMLHSHIGKRMGEDYPMIDKGHTSTDVVSWWTALAPPTGRVCGDYAFRCHIAKKRKGVKLIDVIESVEILRATAVEPLGATA